MRTSGSLEEGHFYIQQACPWHGRMGVSLEDVGEAPDSSPTNFIAKHFGVGVELAVLIPNISRKTRTLWGKERPICPPHTL